MDTEEVSTKGVDLFKKYMTNKAFWPRGSLYQFVKHIQTNVAVITVFDNHRRFWVSC